MGGRPYGNETWIPKKIQGCQVIGAQKVGIARCPPRPINLDGISAPSSGSPFHRLRFLIAAPAPAATLPVVDEQDANANEAAAAVSGVMVAFLILCGLWCLDGGTRCLARDQSLGS